MDVTRFGLWLPVRPSDDSGGVHHPSRFVILTPGYRDLYNQTVEWLDLVSRLKRYSITEILDVLSRLSSVLWYQDEENRSEIQKQLASALFGRPHAIELWKRKMAFERAMRSEGKVAPTILFHQHQVANVAKVALLEMGTSSSTATRDDLTELGEALLMMTDVLQDDEGSLTNLPPDSGDREQRVDGYIAANRLFNRHQDLLHELARSHILYFRDSASLRKHPHYIDLPKRLERVLGLTPDDYWTVVFALMGHWGTIQPERAHEAAGSLNRDTYLKGALSVSEEKSRTLFALVGRPVEDAAEAARSRYQVNDLRPFDFLPLYERPLVHVGNRSFCPVAPFLMEKLTRGLHYLFLDQDVFSRRERRGYLDFMGAVFEKYVTDLLARMYPPISGRLVLEEELRKQTEASVCDALVLYGRDVVLFECKASLLPASSRMDLDPKRLYARAEEIYLRGVQQLGSTIAELREGRIAIPGIPRDNVRYFPVVITLEHSFLTRRMYHAVEAKVQSNGFIPLGNVKPWQFLEIAELEILETVVASGRSLVELLERKVREPHDVGESWRNHIYTVERELLNIGANEYLEREYEDIGQAAVDWVAERTVNPDPTISEQAENGASDN